MTNVADRTKLRRLGNGKRTAFVEKLTPEENDQDYEEFMYKKGNWEKPHPLLKIPGTGGAIWDPRLGRWVIYRYA